MWLRLALKELRYSWRQMITVATILFIGFSGPLLAISLRSSADSFLHEKSREMLTADLALRSLRPITDDEIKTASKTLSPLKVARETELVTMASGRESALVEIHGIDEAFPIFGRFQLRREGGASGSVPGSASELSTGRVAWVFPEVLLQLGLKLGDSVRIGEADFKIVGEILDGPGALRAGFSLAPRMFIGRGFTETTGLTQFGSQVSHRVYFELPPNTDLVAAGEAVKKALPDPDLYLRTPEDSIQGMERFMQFFGRYLGVVTLIVFTLSWMSAFYILEIFLVDRLRQAAVLLTIGATRTLAGGIQVAQVFLVSVISLFAALALVVTGLGGAQAALASRLPEGLVLRVQPGDAGLMTAVALLSAFAFNVPLFLKLARLQPRVLLGENSMSVEVPTGRGTRLLGYVPLILMFWGLSCVLMNSLLYGSALFLALLCASVVGWLGGQALFRLLFAFVRSRPGDLRLAATNLARGRYGTSLCFLVLTLVALVLNLVPHLLVSTTAELRPTDKRELPVFFLFNIPEGSIERLTKFVSDQGGELKYLSPMILARMEKVNGVAPKNEFLLKFPVRISYRENLVPSESIVKGEPIKGRFDPAKQKDPDISMEVRYAAREGFAIGDRIEFDVQGLPVAGVVKNLRRVRWTDFHPNFFMEFQTGVLEEAPKTWLANVHIGDESQRAKLQLNLIREFPELSVVDIGRAIDRITEIANTMIGPIQAVAWVAVVMSFLILVAVIMHNLRLRSGELDTLKVLGADAGKIRRLIVSEYALIGILAGVTGSVFSMMISYGVTNQLFDIPSRFSVPALALAFLTVTLAAAVIAFFAVRRTLAQSTVINPH